MSWVLSYHSPWLRGPSPPARRPAVNQNCLASLTVGKNVSPAGREFRPPGVGSSSEERLLARQIGRLVPRVSEPARRAVAGVDRRRDGPGRRAIADAADGVDAVFREPVRIAREFEIKAVRGRP